MVVVKAVAMAVAAMAEVVKVVAERAAADRVVGMVEEVTAGAREVVGLAEGQVAPVASEEEETVLAQQRQRLLAW